MNINQIITLLGGGVVLGRYGVVVVRRLDSGKLKKRWHFLVLKKISEVLGDIKPLDSRSSIVKPQI